MSENDCLNICLLGASFETGNLGLNALTESAIKCILQRWPNASISLVGTDRQPGSYRLELEGRIHNLKKIPIRYSKKFWLPYHFFSYVFFGFLWKIFPVHKFRYFLKSKNPYFGNIVDCDFAADLTGGDSFSDIYGLLRMTLGFLSKWLFLYYYGKSFFLFPQTYGPYRHGISKWMARYILKKSEIIIARDRSGVEYLEHFLHDSDTRSKIRFVPDVAFVLDSQKTKELDLCLERESSTVIGLNVSGLLYHGGYSQDNMFQLAIPYAQFVQDLIHKLLQQTNHKVLLIPHVFPSPSFEVESDPVACQKIFEKMEPIYPNRLLWADGIYNHNEIKCIIGQCHVMMGSRMHSCIAGLSQGIPTLGLAYSKKFYGVFESVAMQDWVVDLRQFTQEEIFDKVDEFLGNRNSLQDILRERNPQVKEKILQFCFELPWENK